MCISQKAKYIEASPTLELDAKLKQLKSEGVDVVGFGAGEPDFNTPTHINQAAINAINEGFTKYTPAAGIIELREAICNKLKNDNNLDYKPSEIVVSNGAKHSLLNAFYALCDYKDEVIIIAPYWVSYPQLVKIADGVPVIINTTEETNFTATIDKIEQAITSKTKAIVINSPSNPTGMIYTKEQLKDIAELAIDRGLYIVSDEIYEKILYDQNEHVSIASLSPKIKEKTIVVNGFSKTYAMTGWRIGYTASNQEIATVISNIQSHATSNPNSIAQKASIAALNGPTDSLNSMINEFFTRRNYMFDRINKIKGFSCINPSGAFYMFVNISGIIGKKLDGTIIENSNDLAKVLLDKANVAVVPGEGFGTNMHIRLSFAVSMKTIIEGLDRIEKFLEKG